MKNCPYIFGTTKLEITKEVTEAIQAEITKED